MQHKDVKKGNVHVIHNFEFANVDEMNGYVGNVEDLNKVALVNAPYGFYALKSIEPIEWKQIGGVEISVGDLDVYSKEEANQLFTSEEEVDAIVNEKIANKQDNYNISVTEYKCGYTRGGKEVFGIEIDFGALPNATTKTIAIPNYSTNNKYWINTSESYTTKADKSVVMPIPYVPINANLANNTSWICIYISNGSIGVQTYSNLTSFTDTKIVLNYIKG